MSAASLSSLGEMHATIQQVINTHCDLLSEGVSHLLVRDSSAPGLPVVLWYRENKLVHVLQVSNLQNARNNLI